MAASTSNISISSTDDGHFASAPSSPPPPQQEQQQERQQQQAPWAPGTSPRSLLHQAREGFLYNEDHEESLFNGPDDLPTRDELVVTVRCALRAFRGREKEDPQLRNNFWKKVNREEFLQRWVYVETAERMALEDEKARKQQLREGVEGEEGELVMPLAVTGDAGSDNGDSGTGEVETEQEQGEEESVGDDDDDDEFDDLEFET